MIDVLVFNPPYVSSESLPDREEGDWLEIAWEDGRGGAEIEDRTLGALAEVLSYSGVAYVPTCARSRPGEVVRRLRVDECAGGMRWVVEKVGRGGGGGGTGALEDC